MWDGKSFTMSATGDRGIEDWIPRETSGLISIVESLRVFPPAGDACGRLLDPNEIENRHRWWGYDIRLR